MNLYKICYTMFKFYTRCTYVYAMNKGSAITVFNMSAADLGLDATDYKIDCVFEKSHIDESTVMQGAYYEAREDQYNN